ncbi:hypothetical protein [Enterococcus faecium]|uniref:hypothetical protein n=1 Tax=Enterococcus faecium TaxID=1352 RepID=UPI001FD86A3D|nr:hypothetical protein [Enterococcus faecium]
MKNKMLGSMIVLGLAGLVLVSCGYNKDSANDKDGGKTETITFINQKTDCETSGIWYDYMTKFNEKYPDIKVEIQTITEYAVQVIAGMNSEEYGDV